MKKDYTHITMILDRTGSMDKVRDDTIGGFNAFLEDQQKLGTEEGPVLLEEERDIANNCTMTLVQFDSTDPYEVLHDFAPIGDIPKLTRDTFVPRASTPLLDTIGRGINDLEAKIGGMSEEEKPERVVFVILTDGEENCSREFTDRGQIFKMIKERQENDNWQFVFLGADQDAISEAHALGIPKLSTMTYSKSQAGTQCAFAALDDSMAKLRCSADARALYAFSYEDKKKQDELLAQDGTGSVNILDDDSVQITNTVNTGKPDA